MKEVIGRKITVNGKTKARQMLTIKVRLWSANSVRLRNETAETEKILFLYLSFSSAN